MAPKRNASTAGLASCGKASSKKAKKYTLVRGTSFQKITHSGREVHLKINTTVKQNNIWESATHYKTTISYRVADQEDGTAGKFTDLAYFSSYGIDKQHAMFRKEFLPDGNFKHIGVHGPQNPGDLQDSQKIMLLTHDKQGPYNHPKIGMAEDHRQSLRDSKSYHYLAEFELADEKHRGMKWGPVLMRTWLTFLASPDSGLKEYAFTGLFLLSPAPIGGLLSGEDYKRVVHSLIRQYKKSGYEVFREGNDKLNGPIYIMGQQFPKRAALPGSSMFGPGAFDPDVPDSPLTPPPEGEFETPPGLPRISPARQPTVNDRGENAESSGYDNPVVRQLRRQVGLTFPATAGTEDVTMQDTYDEDENSWATRHNIIWVRQPIVNDDESVENEDSVIAQRQRRGTLKVPDYAQDEDITMQDRPEAEDPITPAHRNVSRARAPPGGQNDLRPVSRRGARAKYPPPQHTSVDVEIDAEMTQATRSPTLNPAPKSRTSILQRGINPPRPRFDYPWHNGRVYVVTPDTPQEEIDEGWAWYNNQMGIAPGSEASASASASAAELPPTQAPAPTRRTSSLRSAAPAETQALRSRYDAADASGELRASKILAEGKKQYLIEWEAHPETGEMFEPSWEPKWAAGEALVRAWEAR